MNIRIHHLLLILISSTSHLYAQNDQTTMGATSTAMGGAGTVFNNQWAIYNNIGALSEIESIQAHFSFERRYSLNNFNTVAAGVVSPVRKSGAIGGHFIRFGDEIYNEQRVGIGYNHKIDLVSVGIKVNYVQVAVNDPAGTLSGQRNALVFELGGLAQLTRTLRLGMHGYNLNRAQLRSEGSEDRLPVLLKAGLGYQPIKNLWLTLETEKDVDYPATVRAALDYTLVKRIHVRTGLSTKPFRAAGGIGFELERFELDYGFLQNSALGAIHHISLSYRITSPKKAQ